MANIKRANTSGITKSGAAISDVPDAPTIGAVTDTAAGGTVTVAYTAATTGGAVTTFTATSTPGTITGTGASPITVTGLTDSTAYTFKVKGTNSTATGPESAASSSVTPTNFLVGAYDSIATVYNSGGTAVTMSFTSIPQTYKHLQLRVLSRNAISGHVYLSANATNAVRNHHMFGDGNSTLGLNYADSVLQFGNSAHFTVTIIDILDYSSTVKNKTLRSLSGYDAATSGLVMMSSALFNSTAAISSLSLFSNVGYYDQYSHAALYGIKGA